MTEGNSRSLWSLYPDLIQKFLKIKSITQFSNTTVIWWTLAALFPKTVHRLLRSSERVRVGKRDAVGTSWVKVKGAAQRLTVHSTALQTFSSLAWPRSSVLLKTGPEETAADTTIRHSHLPWMPGVWRPRGLCWVWRRWPWSAYRGRICFSSCLCHHWAKHHCTYNRDTSTQLSVSLRSVSASKRGQEQRSESRSLSPHGRRARQVDFSCHQIPITSRDFS